MGVYYPQVCVVLRVRWENFGSQSSSLDKVYELPIICRNVTVNINEYTQASTFSLEIDYKNFPFDPRAIRAVGVKIFMENMNKVGSDGEVRIKPSDNNVILIGFADEESIRFDESKRTVKMEGRDFVGLLADRKYPSGTLNVEQKLDVVLKGILSSLPETEAIELDNRVPGELPTLSKFWSEKDKTSGKINIDSGMSYWDVVSKVVHHAGLIAYIEIDRLVLSKPRVLYSKDRGKIFVYGKNIRQLEYKRKIGRMKNFNVIVRSINLIKKDVETAQIPAEATAAWSKDTGIPNKEMVIQTLKPDGTPVDTGDSKLKAAPYLSFNVANVTSKDHLISIGEKIYEEIGRQQIEGSLETKEMEVPDGKVVSGSISDRKRFDILKLRIGMPIKIFIDQGDLNGVNSLQSVSEKETFLKRRGYSPKVASVFAESMKYFDSIFYTKRIEYQLDSENGFKCKVDFINFIEIPKSLAGE
jgi:prophage tail gpP-like protein